ncbi:hypothetical protein FA95DRAFT_1677127 [Auriscalpium vulgare]|uniref:Uncharacterized protein n=1 Tax=Auriscalpium vulgare TaxID=40419 RepID=A0ACB8S0Z9_9AGAM|nr:hypothetical protein FA95DRAFT_1677127 [Auriscalpium vulgare]
MPRRSSLFYDGTELQHFKRHDGRYKCEICPHMKTVDWMRRSKACTHEGTKTHQVAVRLMMPPHRKSRADTSDARFHPVYDPAGTARPSLRSLAPVDQLYLRMFDEENTAGERVVSAELRNDAQQVTAATQPVRNVIPSAGTALLLKIHNRSRERGTVQDTTSTPVVPHSSLSHAHALPAPNVLTDTSSLNNSVDGREFLFHFSKGMIEDKLLSIGALSFANRQQILALSADIKEIKVSQARTEYYNAEMWLKSSQKTALRAYCMSTLVSLCTTWEDCADNALNHWRNREKKKQPIDAIKVQDGSPAQRAVELLLPTYITQCKQTLSEAVIDSVRRDGILVLDDFALSFLIDHGVPGETLDDGRLAQFALLRKVAGKFTSPSADKPASAVSVKFWSAAEAEYARYVKHLGRDQASGAWKRWIAHMIAGDHKLFWY